MMHKDSRTRDLCDTLMQNSNESKASSAEIEEAIMCFRNTLSSDQRREFNRILDMINDEDSGRVYLAFSLGYSFNN